MASKRTELIKLLYMTDQEMIKLFEKKDVISCLPYAFQYNWRKRLSIYSKPNAITSHEYKWLVDALLCHSHDEFLLLREEIKQLIKMEFNENDENDENDEKKNLVKKTQSCPSFLNSTYTDNITIKDVLEKTVNGC